MNTHSILTLLGSAVSAKKKKWAESCCMELVGRDCRSALFVPSTSSITNPPIFSWEARGELGNHCTRTRKQTVVSVRFYVVAARCSDFPGHFLGFFLPGVPGIPGTTVGSRKAQTSYSIQCRTPSKETGMHDPGGISSSRTRAFFDAFGVQQGLPNF